jgi:hypothetical protein
MIKRSTWLGAALAILFGFGLYQMKYEVQAQEEQLARLHRQIQLGQESVAVLKAEWAYLNRPDRLADLTQRHLLMVPLAPAQFGDVAALPTKSTEAEPAAVTVESASAKGKSIATAASKTDPRAAEPRGAPTARPMVAKAPLPMAPIAELKREPMRERDIVIAVDGTMLASVPPPR